MTYFPVYCRCIADHEREGEFPFLDEEVVGFLQQLPIWSKVMDLSALRVW